MIIKNSFALIPARSGSKRLPGKNIKLLNGKPLIKYSIDAALKSIVEDVYVSTDCSDIQQLSISFGAKAPFLRPKKLSSDDAPDWVVINHFINYLISLGKNPQFVVYLRPTMPFRTVEQINSCLELISKRENIDVVRTVINSKYPPFWIKSIDDFGFLKPFRDELSKFADLRSQDLPATYVCDGYVDIVRVQTFIKYKSFNKGNVYPYFRAEENFYDIDTESDWLEAERHLKN